LQSQDSFGESLQEHLKRLRAESFVDYPSVVTLKRDILNRLAQWAARELTESAAVPKELQAFSAFKREHGTDIETFTSARTSHARGGDPVAAFNFDAFVEWNCRVQLARCVANPHGVGLILDLAIGTSANSAEVCANPIAFAQKVSIGAPPDSFNPKGQNWSLTPLHPEALRHERYATLIGLLEANMPIGGGIRIDHMMWVCRQFWIPDGAGADRGVYVKFDEAALLAIIRLISVRRRCLVVGEDLGTVPSGFRARLTASGIYTMHVLRFERTKAGVFKKLSTLRRHSAIFLSTHDMPTLAAYIDGCDIELSARIYPEDAIDQTEAKRLRSVEVQSLLSTYAPLTCQSSQKTLTPDIVASLHDAASSGPCQFIVHALDDVFAETTPVNIPGTINEYPNWRRKYRMEVSRAVLP
jgi:4-alpha-glucanotransferase